MQASAWNTIDELFPLLKYDNAADLAADPSDAVPRVSSREAIVLTISVCVIGVAGIALWLQLPAQRSPAVHPTSQHRHVNPRTALPPPRPAAAQHPKVSPQPRGRSQTVTPAATIAPQPRSTVTRPGVSMPVPQSASVVVERQRRRAEEQRLREQEQRRIAQDQADRAIAAERTRAYNERQAAQKQAAAGVDTIIPLDEHRPVYVGGSWVSVKIHENDVTSFDAWVDGAFYDDVRKQKGITQSGTDETLIYRTGGASLYYVWELSGKLNHCRLRVRQQ